MISYSRWLARTISAIVVAACLSLLAAAYWQQQVQQINRTIFQPVARIEQARQLLHQIELVPGQSATGANGPGAKDQASSTNSPSVTSTASADRATIADCTERRQAVLQGRLMLALGIAPQQALAVLQSAVAETRLANGAQARCDGLAQALAVALKLRQTGRGDAPDETTWVTQSLAENLSWNRALPCIEASAQEQRVLLIGNPIKCGDGVDWVSAAALPITGSLRQMNARIVASATTAALAGQFEPKGAVQITIDPNLQKRLDRWSACLEQETPCAGPPVPAPAEAATLVVIDAEQGDILGLWCHGPRCQQGSRAGMGQMAALLFEAPPASTSKLIHALAIARTASVAPGMLERQIKTSGQNDGNVSKRNEWWERQVICDPSERGSEKRQAGARGRCGVMTQARRIAEDFGFNEACAPGPSGPSADCGRVSVAGETPQIWLSGQLGRIASDAPSGPATTLGWSAYEAIRQGRARPTYGSGYEATSQAVQSVLGAGDARVGPLGLANLSARLWGQAEGRPAMRPRLLKPSSTPSASVARPTERDLRARRSATTVLAGMRKVVEGAEPGWQGAGTAAAAVKLTFGQPCSGPCGLWAKTGTVSKADPVWAGTTLFTALVDTRVLQQWQGRVPVLLRNRRIALGVIVQPPPPTESISLPGHAASQLGMALVGELFNP